MKNKTVGGIATAIIAVTLLAGTAFAHHSFTAEYDRSKPVMLVGKLTLVKLANPHAWLYIDVVTEGKTVNWAIEMGAGNTLIRNGWTKDDLKVGTVLHVNGSMARSGHPTANATTITLENGKKMYTGTSNPAAAEQ